MKEDGRRKQYQAGDWSPTPEGGSTGIEKI